MFVSPKWSTAPNAVRALVSHSSIMVASYVLASLLIIYIYLHDLGLNPYGFFCDEAEIGLESSKLVYDYLLSGRIPLFYNHFGGTLGALPLYSGAPFILVFGLSEFSVRLSSAAAMLASFVVLYLILRKLNVKHSGLPVLLFALTPVVIHIARINFGHSPSIFFTLLGFLLYVHSRGANLRAAMLSGVFFAVAAYGYPAFYPSSVLFVSILILVEVIYNRLDFRKYRAIAVTLLAFVICYLPIVYQAIYSPEFFLRLRMKDRVQTGVFSITRVQSMLENYPKYYRYDYLFATGELGMPGGIIQRYSVNDSGILLKAALPLLVIGVVGLLATRGDTTKRYFLPFFILFLVCPLPDLITTSTTLPPYTYATFPDILFLPFVTAYALEWIGRLGAASVGRSPGGYRTRWNEGIYALVTLIVLVSGLHFSFVTYQKYPLVSSGFWGWQSGPKEMISYFIDHNGQYDEFYMDGKFNAPIIFLDFYLRDVVLKEQGFRRRVRKTGSNQTTALRSSKGSV